jgi:hypothetical protein
MEKLVEAFIELILQSPAFKEKLMLAVTDQLDGLTLKADDIDGFDAAVNECVDEALKNAQIDASISIR